MQPSLSLLSGVDLNKPVPRPYDLGMVDFVDSVAFGKRMPLFLKSGRQGQRRGQL